MSVWDIKLEREEIIFGNALVSLYNIKSDVTVAERELVHSHSYYELHTVLRGGHTFSGTAGRGSRCGRSAFWEQIAPFFRICFIAGFDH